MFRGVEGHAADTPQTPGHDPDHAISPAIHSTGAQARAASNPGNRAEAILSAARQWLPVARHKPFYREAAATPEQRAKLDSTN